MSNATTNVATVSDAAYNDEIAHGVVAVDFTAEWCPPCRMMDPIVEQVAKDYAGSLRVLRMDTDVNPATMVKLGVRGLPTLLLYRDGEVVDRIIGAVPQKLLRQRIDALLTPKP